MTKRRSSASEAVPASESSKKQRTADSGATTFFSLPLELRDIIYSDILDGISKPPLHPWDAFPKRKDCISLLLVNRQINSEVKDLFDKLYADKIVLYFDDLLKINNFAENLPKYPALRNPKFHLRVSMEDNEDEFDAKTEGALMLIEYQSGFHEDWHDVPSCFRTDAVVWDQGSPRDWKPEDDGFARSTISHGVSCPASYECLPFKKLGFPTMQKGCHITTYRWRNEGPLDDEDWDPDDGDCPDSAAMTLEGRIESLELESAPIDATSERMECERLWEERDRVGYIHDGCGCYRYRGPRPLDLETARVLDEA